MKQLILTLVFVVSGCAHFIETDDGQSCVLMGYPNGLMDLWCKLGTIDQEGVRR